MSKLTANNRKALECAIALIESEQKLYVLPPYTWHVAVRVLEYFLNGDEVQPKSAKAAGQ